MKGRTKCILSEYSMPKLIIIDRAGTRNVIEGTGGLTVMENVRNAGFDEMLALCGGSCACATCHVYVEDRWLEAVGAVGENECDLLDSTEHRLATSRLSCQIPFEGRLDGLTVTIAPED